MSHENKRNLEYISPTQDILSDIITICDTKVSRIKDDYIAYLRTPDATVMIHDHHDQQTSNEIVGDYEVWVLQWLNHEKPGYGPHTLTTYKFFTNDDGIRVKRLFEVNDSNGDKREMPLQTKDVPLPDYLTDTDPDFALVKQAFEGMPRNIELFGSTEQQMEAINRFFGGNPEETQLGLHDMTQDEAESLRILLLNAEPTHDPYFEL